MKRRRCEDEKVFYRPPLLEEPCAQTLSGKKLQTFFFSSSVADIALKARSLHEHKLKERCLYKDITCPNEQANQSKTTHKPQKTNTHKTTRKSPSQTCVSPAETAKQTAKHQKHTKKRGRSPNKTPTKSICQGMQWLVHCISLKNVPMN